MPEPTDVVVETPTPEAEQVRVEALVDETLGIKPPVEKPKEEPKVEPEAPTEEVVDSEEAEESEEPEKPIAPQEPSDPELFIEVEDATGEKFKITKIEDLPQDFTPKNNRQIMEIIRATDKLEQDIAKRDADKTQKEQDAVVEAGRNAVMKAWDGEINELISEGLLDKPKVAASSPKYSEDPAVKQTDAVYLYMKEENDKRREAGNPNFLTSFKDAFRLQNYEQMKKDQVEAKKAETNLAKVKAGMMGGNNTAAKDEPVYVAGSKRSIWDI
jgi:hypothetical protein